MRIALGILSLVCLLIPPATKAAESPWLAGVAQTKITPDGTYWMGGYASRKKPSEGTDLDLWAKALVLQDAKGEIVVFVTLDLLVVTPQISEAVLKGVKTRFELDPKNVFLNCSHTHCGPELRLYRETLHDIPQPMVVKMRDYVGWLNARLLDLIGEAISDLRPAELSVSQDEAGFAVNRRENRGKDLIERTAAGTLKGPVDHHVPVLRVIDQRADRTRAILFGYACHNTIMSFFKTSGDYAGYAQKFLEEDHPGAVALFVMGAGGDQNPNPRRQEEHLALHGRALADAVNRALQKPQKEVGSGLQVSRVSAPLAFQPPPNKADLEKQLNDRNQYKRWKARLLLGRINAGIEPASAYDLPVQAVRLGNEVLMLAMGGEVVVDYSLRFKREFAGSGPTKPMLWFAGYTGDVSFYLPSLRVLKEGGYEGGQHMVYTQFTGPFEEDVEERVFSAVRKAVKRVSRIETGTGR